MVPLRPSPPRQWTTTVSPTDMASMMLSTSLVARIQVRRRGHVRDWEPHGPQSQAARRGQKLRDGKPPHLELLEQRHENLRTVGVPEAEKVVPDERVGCVVQAWPPLARGHGESQSAGEAVSLRREEVDPDGALGHLQRAPLPAARRSRSNDVSMRSDPSAPNAAIPWPVTRSACGGFPPYEGVIPTSMSKMRLP